MQRDSRCKYALKAFMTGTYHAAWNTKHKILHSILQAVKSCWRDHILPVPPQAHAKGLPYMC